MKWHLVSLAIVVILLQHNVSLAQFSFKNQKQYKPFGKAFTNVAHIKTSNFKEEVLEIRFWKVQYTNTVHELFIFKLLNTKEWELKKYNFCSWDWESFSNIKTGIISLSKEWNSRWDSLLNNHFLTLPTQTEVQKKWKASNGTQIVIADGSEYVVELLTKKNKRKYSYVNPEAYLRHYDMGNLELILMNKILNLLEDELKLKSLENYKCE